MVAGDWLFPAQSHQAPSASAGHIALLLGLYKYSIELPPVILTPKIEFFAISPRAKMSPVQYFPSCTQIKATFYARKVSQETAHVSSPNS